MKPKLKRCVITFYQNNASSKRKRNSNLGDTVFNPKKKQTSTFTPLEHFKRLQWKQQNKSITDEQRGRVFRMISANMLQ